MHYIIVQKQKAAGKLMHENNAESVVFGVIHFAHLWSVLEQYSP